MTVDPIPDSAEPAEHAGHAAALAALEPACTVEEAFALFDALPGVGAGELRGRWHGRELATGHPLDGLLEATGWYGKQFDDEESVHPLLFRAGGRIVSVDPRWAPMGVAGRVPTGAVARARFTIDLLAPVLRTRKPRARLREVRHRGVVTTAMVYDHLPIIDTFRRVDADTLLGVMDLRTHPAPYFFVLARD
ncbi:DUF4334 domain-containing protein [Nocardioides sp. GY 10113]|uniref:DUF4334 domain-containing protein n=1 Tax=Nocardioides sp. GY 10113 TaxID=2569761 RepID=UPI0010A83F48|nr:DUF4334 domain-containing protein [Nocardioides sp. GY 10113]TIC88824.1 DUF4334 domain-containing protein [Nocardioides sp. GY 10113]